MPSLNPPRPPYIPPNWPPDVHYLVAPFYGHLPPPVLALVQSKTPPPPHKPNPNVEIRMVTNPAHPACGQRGLFAKQKIKKGELIIWYTGHVHLDPDATPELIKVRETSDYDLTLCSVLSSLRPLPGPTVSSSPSVASDPALPWATHGLAVDASQMGNEARMCNDYRGVPPTTPSITEIPKVKPGKPQPPPKSRPNGFFHSMRTSSLTVPPVLEPHQSTPAERMKAERGELRMGIFAIDKIDKGEEILISYGKSFWSTRKGGGD